MEEATGLDALIFDMDGVLVDSQPAYFDYEKIYLSQVVTYLNLSSWISLFSIHAPSFIKQIFSGFKMPPFVFCRSQPENIVSLIWILFLNSCE